MIDDVEGDGAPAPAHWEADVVAADGGIVHLRPIRPSDADALVAFHGGLSQRTRYLRYFSAYPRIPPRDLIRFTTVDHHDRVALIAELAGEIIAVGRYERLAAKSSPEGSSRATDEAEVAFVVADAHQGRGIGSVLLEHLAAAGREVGIRRFQALVLAENTGMIRVFREAGYETTRHLEHGEVTLEFDIDETAVTETVMREREQRAEARSIARLLAPSSVAVVGASNDADKIGSAVFGNLLRMGLDGPLYPVNADARHVHGVRAYPSVLDVPDDIDVVVIAVPASAVPGVVEQCAQRGVRGLVVISGGFGERGSDDERERGQQAQRELVAEARVHGMRVVGPNCLGIVNTDPQVRLNASLAPLPPLRGRAGFFCQSGALGVAVLGEAARRGIGVSTFVSAGNRADVSGNDLMQYWETDPDTDVVLMYLESFGNPRKFARVARRLGRRKPIVAVKGGAGTVVAGLRPTSVEVHETSVQTLFEKSGVIRVDTVGDLFDVALLLTSQPLPRGSRVAVVGNSTALGVLVINALAEGGLRLARLDDVGVEAGAAAFEDAMRTALADPGVDAVVVVFVPPLQRASSEDVAVSLRMVATHSDKPVVSTFLGFEGVPGGLSAEGETSPAAGSVPSYASPERAVRALARVCRYAAWRRRGPGSVPALEGVDLPAARELVRTALAATPVGRELSREEARVLLGHVGIETADGADGGPAVEVVATVRDDPSFGALLSFGLGGVATELLDDRAYASVPLTVTDAEDVLDGPRAAPLLDGHGGGAVANRVALRDLVLRLSGLADAVPEIGEAVLRVHAGADRASVVDAEVWVAAPTARPDTGPRRLRGL
ncbi:GNAT family N-acetyltransferase [uncultured Jatrophihabitans sp.]|uniref:bifunctional acetate--CoA ligase family protein/GNAT family N-acetyltransferase n=1 Tax=uncultured Jatrophihabitans sp. TaxID=1610747 RepID=UPI0035CABD35